MSLSILDYLNQSTMVCLRINRTSIADIIIFQYSGIQDWTLKTFNTDVKFRIDFFCKNDAQKAYYIISISNPTNNGSWVSSSSRLKATQTFFELYKYKQMSPSQYRISHAQWEFFFTRPTLFILFLLFFLHQTGKKCFNINKF